MFIRPDLQGVVMVGTLVSGLHKLAAGDEVPEGVAVNPALLVATLPDPEPEPAADTEDDDTLAEEPAVAPGNKPGRRRKPAEAA